MESKFLCKEASSIQVACTNFCEIYQLLPRCSIYIPIIFTWIFIYEQKRRRSYQFYYKIPPYSPSFLIFVFPFNASKNSRTKQRKIAQVYNNHHLDRFDSSPPRKDSSSTDIKNVPRQRRIGLTRGWDNSRRHRLSSTFSFLGPRIFARGAKTGVGRRERFLFATSCLPLHRDFSSPSGWMVRGSLTLWK